MLYEMEHDIPEVFEKIEKPPQTEKTHNLEAYYDFRLQDLETVLDPITAKEALIIGLGTEILSSPQAAEYPELEEPGTYIDARLQAMGLATQEILERGTLSENLHYKIWRLGKELDELWEEEKLQTDRIQLVKTLMSKNGLFAREIVADEELQAVLAGSKPAFSLDSEERRRKYQSLIPDITPISGITIIGNFVVDTQMTSKMVEACPELFTTFGYNPETPGSDPLEAVTQVFSTPRETATNQETWDQAIGTLLGIPEQAQLEWNKYQQSRENYRQETGQSFPGITRLGEHIPTEAPERLMYDQFVAEYTTSQYLGTRNTLRNQWGPTLKELYQKYVTQEHDDLVEMEVDKSFVYHWGVYYTILGKDEFRSATARERARKIRNLVLGREN